MSSLPPEREPRPLPPLPSEFQLQPQTLPPLPPQFQQFSHPQPSPYPPGTNGFAIASLAISFFGICGAVLATIFSLVALSQIRRTGQRGHGLAIAGLCISALWVVGVALSVMLVQLNRLPGDGDNTSVNAMSPGQCVTNVKQSSAVFSLPVVPCTQPHEAEVVGSFNLTGSTYPGVDQIAREAADRCEKLLTEYAPAAVLEEVTDIYYLYPRAADWGKGKRTVTCLAMHDAARTKSLRE